MTLSVKRIHVYWIYLHVHFESLSYLLDSEVEFAVDVRLRSAEGVADVNDTHCVLKSLSIVYLHLTHSCVGVAYLQHHRESRLVILQ